jgi:phosphohistidine phosphatase SixA
MFIHCPRYAMKAALLILIALTLLSPGVNRVAAQTFPTLSDIDLVQTSCDSSRMRQLSADGRQTSIDIGNAIRALGLPIGKVMASPYCRTVETAQLMQLGAVEATTDVMNLRVASYFGGRDAIIGTAQMRLSTRPAAATNAVIVAHGNVAQAATPIYPGEGEAVIFRPDGNGGFQYIARIAPQDWPRIIEQVTHNE